MTNNPATPLKDDDEEKKEIKQQLKTLPKGRLSDEKIAELKALKEKAKKHGFDISNLDALLNENNAGDEINVNELDDHATAEDGEWKDGVREAVKKANNKLNNNFEEDKENTEHLTFKDGENTIAFSSPNQAYVEGEQKAFDELVASAKEMGKTSIRFGKFEEHPEYKAMLFLACIEQGIEMKNAPTLKELREDTNPKVQEVVKQIEEAKKQQYQNASKALVDSRKEFFEAIKNPKTPEEQELKKTMDSLAFLEKGGLVKGGNSGEEIKKLKNQIKETPLGKKLEAAINTKAKLLQEGIAAGILTKEDAETRKQNLEKPEHSKNESMKQKTKIDLAVLNQVLNNRQH